ncbi:MAG: ABC transporter permease [Clostridiales bacterium]|jgi:simple sugar transport system permease protein|nr:ABC transporter permease [Clostridiales bacterium]
MNNILYNTVLFSSPILLCTLGGIFAYKANVLNIALEGMMLTAAFVAALTVYLTGSYLAAVALAVGVSLFLGVVFSVFGVSRKGNVIIIGLALNLFASGFTALILRRMGIAKLVAADFSLTSVRLFSGAASVPFLGAFANHTLLTYLSYALIFAAGVLMFKTKTGVYIRVAGENPEAARAVGININRVRYAAVLIGAAACGLAGVSLAVDCFGGVYAVNMTFGRGFIAIAAIYCGRGYPLKAALYAVLFGFSNAAAMYLQLTSAAAARLLTAVPYVMIVVLLTVASVLKNKGNSLRGFYNE